MAESRSTIERAKSSVRRKYQDARWAARTSHRHSNAWSYLGWIGEGNLGDEAIFEGQRRAFDVPLVPFPTRRATTVVGLAAAVGSLPPPRTLLLGGGTVVGRPEWLTRVDDHRTLAGGQELVVWGAGVEDPEFSSGREFVSSESLRRWAERLRDARTCGVRGPRSRDLLAALGVEAEVVGDPALRLFAKHTRATQDGSVLLNIAAPEATYLGQSGEDSVLQTARLAKALVSQGHSVRLFPMHAKDLGPIHAVSQLVPRAVVTPLAGSVQSLLTRLSSAQLVISQRLHGNILAAALGIPFISLDYRPKCRDFAESVHMEKFNIRPDRTSPVEFMGLVDLLLSDRTLLTRYRTAIDSLRQCLPPDVTG